MHRIWHPSSWCILNELTSSQLDIRFGGIITSNLYRREFCGSKGAEGAVVVNEAMVAVAGGSDDGGGGGGVWSRLIHSRRHHNNATCVVCCCTCVREVLLHRNNRFFFFAIRETIDFAPCGLA